MPRRRAPSLPQGRWRPTRKAQEADEAAPALAQADARRDFTKPPWRGRNAFRSIEDLPNRRRPRESPRDRNRQGDGEKLRLQPRPDGVSRGFGLAALRGRREGFGPASFRRATGEVSASMRALEPVQASARPGPEGKRRRDFGPASATRRGSARGLRASPETQRDRTGREPRSGTGESGGGPCVPEAIPKPPSERWPRHPATAVKAGTSGGRWRHRPTLRFEPPRLSLAMHLSRLPAFAFS
jgi:hypothetical protein